MPRRIAWGALGLTLALMMTEAGSGGTGSWGHLLLWIGLVAKVALLTGWALRLRGLLPTRGRHLLWPIAAGLFAVSGSAGMAAGSVLVTVLGFAALGLAVWGLAAEHQRTRERLTFV